VPTVTRLAAKQRGRVAVELDGAPWRTLPLEVVARAGLSEGRALDRPALRLLRHELRRAEALQVAGGALRRQDLSSRGVAARLRRAAVAPAAVEESLAVLARAGLVDDARFARTRAGTLAERGYGDAAIRYDLERQGVAPDPIQDAIESLEPEGERARRVLSSRGPGVKTARYLASKGFGAEALEAAVGADFAPDP
jgi:SOS response regulatory protein OraA/RecX